MRRYTTSPLTNKWPASTRIGSLILTGYTTPIHQQPLHIRNTILQSWATSYLGPLPVIFKTVTFIGKNLWLKTSPSVLPSIGFPKMATPYKPGSHWQYDFLQFPPSNSDEPEVIETDVVVIGSGCGGGVVAKNIAEAGHKVIVADKSYYFPTNTLPMSERDAGIHLYENGGVIASDDSSISVVAGATWGGGGTVNWSASLQTQGFVRKEWAEEKGLPFFQSQAFQECLDRVCDRMGVSDKHIQHNHGNGVLMEGARKLGWHCKAVPQNTGGKEHSCGHCSLGCSVAEKQGPIVSWLPDAARAGAQFVEGFKAEKVLFETIDGQKTAVGVQGVWTSRNASGGVDGPVSGKAQRQVIIKAKRVVLSAGTLWSPLILTKSGLTNPHIGRNLHLHPVNVIGGTWKRDIKPWEGPILTTVCTSFENLDLKGHGTKLETIVMIPAQYLTLLNWESGQDFKTEVLKYRHMNGYISLTRDRDSGRVYADPKTGNPRIAYTPSKFDRAHTMVGNVALAKILYVMGASEISACITGVRRFVRPEKPQADQDDAFEQWLHHLESVGNAPPNAVWASAHQMGTCRMGRSQGEGVVDEMGKVWGTGGLFVADASVFPSASGVNPMVTNMAVSDWISRGVAQELGAEKRK
jgi:choline dehydrogenase-like flavoprotein